jgi:hypothetical protein
MESVYDFKIRIFILIEKCNLAKTSNKYDDEKRGIRPGRNEIESVNLPVSIL